MCIGRDQQGRVHEVDFDVGTAHLLAEGFVTDDAHGLTF
jgi:hypothetical protein